MSTTGDISRNSICKKFKRPLKVEVTIQLCSTCIKHLILSITIQTILQLSSLSSAGPGKQRKDQNSDY